MGIPLLADLLVLLALAVTAALACHRLRLPVIVGFLLTGAVAGPHGLALVQRVGAVELLAEVGLVVLLFTIGIEFSLEQIVGLRRPALLGGTLQVGLATGAGAGLARAAGLAWTEALFVGFLLSLSSTAVVVRALQGRAELDSLHGRTSLGILIFQDLAVVPMMLLVPFLAGRTPGPGRGILGSLALGLVVVVLVIAAARRLVPWLLLLVTRTRDREVFLLSVLVLVLAVAWLTSRVGLSLALGAFLAGLILSESEYGQQALATLLPFRDVFTSLFFVSMGMLLDVSLLGAEPGRIALLALGVLAVKAVTAGMACALIGLPFRTTFLVAVSLGQIGEFSFVLARSGLEQELLLEGSFQTFLAVSVLTLATTPLVIAVAPRAVEWMQQRRAAPSRAAEGASPAGLANHLVIVGFGLNGRNLARAASRAGIPYVVLEINPDAVRQGRMAGEPLLYGDATEETVLERVGIRSARITVVAVSDPSATRRIVGLARRLAPAGHVIARTRYVQEIRPLLDAGADEVIPEEFETSIEIFTRVLRHYLVPEEEVLRLTAEVRAGAYDALLRAGAGAPTGEAPSRSEAEIRTIRIEPGSVLDGTTLAEADLRRTFGVTVAALRTDETLLAAPDPDRRLRAGDTLVVVGRPEQVARLLRGAKS